MSCEKHITINILPQDPFAWIAIAAAIILTAVAFNMRGNEGLDVHRERTNQIQILIENGQSDQIHTLFNKGNNER